MRDVDKPRIPMGRHEMDFLKPEEIRAFIDHNRSEEIHNVVYSCSYDRYAPGGIARS